MRGLGLLIGIIFLLSKLTGKKPIDPKKKKFSPETDDDLYPPEEEDIESDFRDYEDNSDIKSKEVQKKPREDRRNNINSEVLSHEKHDSDISSSSLLFDTSKDIKKELVKSIVYSEVIGKPKSLRK